MIADPKEGRVKGMAENIQNTFKNTSARQRSITALDMNNDQQQNLELLGSINTECGLKKCKQLILTRWMMERHIYSASMLVWQLQSDDTACA